MTIDRSSGSRRSGDGGFSLIELMSVVGIIGLISAIALPGLLRARMAGNEASAIASLRSISSAQSAYAASCGFGFFAPSLSVLAQPPASGPAYIGPDLDTDPSFKSAYEISLVAGPVVTGAPVSCNGAAAGTVVETYFATAAPAGTGFRYFGTNQGGLIYADRVPIAPTQNGAPPGATPIQ